MTMPAPETPVLALGAHEMERRHRLDLALWTEAQLTFLRANAMNVLWRAGNQVGKSYALAADIVWTARQTHPYRDVRRFRPGKGWHHGPVEILVVSYSLAQMRPLMWKIWQFLDPHEIDQKLSCTKGGGLKGYKEPHITFTSGPGAGSVIYFATYKQGTEALAGPTLDGVFCDEPMSEEVYGELQPRLIRHKGRLRITMTPTPEAAPQTWLKQKIDLDKEQAEKRSRERDWQDLRTTISETALKPVSPSPLVPLAPFLRQEDIDRTLRKYLADELPMRRDGAWEGVLSDRALTNFGAHAITDGHPTKADGVLIWAVGVDHGAKAGRQAAVLVCLGRKSQRVYVMDEYRSDGRTNTEQDAKAILAMLRRHGLDWWEIDYWIGDTAHRGDWLGNAKSNEELMLEMTKVLGKSKKELKAGGMRWRNPGKEGGSVRRGYRLVNGLLHGPDGEPGQMLVHSRCESVVSSAKTWVWGKLQDPAKDILDAWRYCVELLFDQHVLRPQDRYARVSVD